MSNDFAEKEFAEKKDLAAGASAPASAPILGGGVGNPPAKRVWRKPSIRVMPVGATASGYFGHKTLENSEYVDLDCDDYFYATTTICMGS